MKQAELTVICHCTESGPELKILLLDSFETFLFRELGKFASTPDRHV